VVGAVVLALAGVTLTYMLFRGPADPPATDPEGAEAQVEGSTAGPVPSDTSHTAGPSAQERAAIDALIEEGKLDEAQGQIDALLERHPGNPELVWRDARQLGKRPGMHEAAVRRYGEALKKAPGWARDRDFI